MQVDGADAAGHSIHFGIVPGNRKSDGSVKQHVEIVGVVRVLPEVVRVDDEPLAHALLESGVEVVSVAGPDGAGYRPKNVLLQATRAAGAGQQQVFVKWGFEGARVGRPQHRV